MIKARYDGSTDPKDDHHYQSTSCNDTYTLPPGGKKPPTSTNAADPKKDFEKEKKVRPTTPAGEDKTQEPGATTTSTPANPKKNFEKKVRPTTTPGDQAKCTPHTTTTPAWGNKTQEPKTTTTSTAANSGGSPSQSNITQYLDGHNNFRKQHGAQALTWSDTLASTAQAWVQKCEY